MTPRWLRSVIASGLLISLLVACAGGDSGNEQTTTTTRSGTSTTGVAASTTEATAPAIEGNLTFYTFFVTAEAEAMVAAFEEEYPDVQVTLYREGGPTIFERFMAEQGANQYIADVIALDAPLMEQVREAGYLMQWVPASAEGVSDLEKSDSYVGVKQTVNGMVVNTAVFPDEALWPKDWSDFADPRPEWQDKVCLGDARTLSHSYTTLYGLYSELGLEETTRIYEGLGSIGATIYTGVPQAREWLGTERCGIVFQIPFLNYGAILEDGTPAKWIAPASGHIHNTSMAGVVATSDNPVAAQRFVEFMLSSGGQTVFADRGSTPLGVNPPTHWWPEDELGPWSNDMLIEYDQRAAEEHRSELVSMWSNAIGAD